MNHSLGKIAVERNVIAGDINHLALTIRENDPQWMIASVTPMKWLKPIDEANAARLAHCWNTHDELVEACRAAQAKLESLGEEHNKTGVMLDEVLAKETP